MNAEILWDSCDCGFVTDFSWNCFELSLASEEKFVKIRDFIFLSFLSSQSMTAAVKRQLNCYGYVWNRWKNTKFIFISVYFLRNVIKDYLNEILDPHTLTLKIRGTMSGGSVGKPITFPEICGKTLFDPPPVLCVTRGHSSKLFERDISVQPTTTFFQC